MQSIAPAAPIPDILLSQAKDDRYISEVSSLLSQIASVCLFPLFSDRRRSSSSGSGAPYTATPVTTSTGGDDEDDDDNHGKHHFIHRILPELNLLASIIVHSSAFICYNRATGNGTVQQSTLGMESLNLVSHRDIATWKKRERSSSSNISSILHSVRDRFMEVCSPSSWNVNHFQFFIFLQTIVPYILQRVHRGGWLEDLRGLIPVNRSERINDIGEEERVLRNDERLRGSARRRLFDEQRRQMLQSFSSTQTNAHGSHGGDSVNESTNPSNDIANLMDTDQSVHNGRLPKKIATLSWNAIRRIALATSSLSHGAHSLPSRHDNNTLAANNEALDRTTKIIKWLFRLHLALFYWNGMYPSVLHRLTGRTIVSDGMSAIVANRPTYKPIAAIILFQAGTSFARATAEASIEVAHFIQIAWFRWRGSRRRQMEQRQNSGIRRLPNAAYTERAEYMDLIEDHVPGIGSVDNNNTFKLHATTKKKDNKQQTTGLTNHGLASCCGICLNERVHPSAPSVCGHVFCWSCILHWVSNVRAECPLCRAATRRQDIIPLYNNP